MNVEMINDNENHKENGIPEEFNEFTDDIKGED